MDPLPVHEADRRDFTTILKTISPQVICSHARRDPQGRKNGISPLYPQSFPEIHHQRARIPQHAAGWADRLFARPAEFQAMPMAQSALSCWIDWHTDRLTIHDGLVRANHPLVMAALDRRQSATSLAKLLRDPLGYLWTYGFRWEEPRETEEPLLLDARSPSAICFMPRSKRRSINWWQHIAEAWERPTRRRSWMPGYGPRCCRHRLGTPVPVPPPVIWAGNCRISEVSRQPP